MFFFTAVGVKQKASTTNFQHSVDMDNKPVHSKLSLAFKNEKVVDIKRELLACLTMEMLMQENFNGCKSWQYEHVSQASLQLVIARWLELSSAIDDDECLNYKTLLKGMSVEATMRLISCLNQTTQNSSVSDIFSFAQDDSFDYNNIIKEFSELLSFVLDNVALLLLSMHQQFGLDSLFLNAELNYISPVLLFISSALRLNQLLSQKEKLKSKHKVEILFILTSMILALVGITSSSVEVVYIGLALSIVSSVIELSKQWQKYKQSPLDTDRRISYLQNSIKLSLSLLHSAIASTLTVFLIAGVTCLVPTIIALISLTVSLLIWELLPRQNKLNFKIKFGFEKKSYQDEIEESKLNSI